MIKLTEKTLPQLCLSAAERYKNRTAFALFRDNKIVNRISYCMMGIRARQIASVLGQLGINPGDRILLLSENCPEWPLAYFGIALAGAVSVPLLTGFSAEQIRHISDHVGISAICLSRSMAAKIESSATTPLIFIDSISETNITVALDGHDRQVPLPAPEADTEHLPRRKPEDIASIIYTSGTLGNSKGVMLSGANLISSALASLSLVKIRPSDRLLSVLPLAHTYECGVGLLAPLMSGAHVTYLDRPPSPSVLLPAAKALRPTAIITVPLFIEKLYRSAIVPALRQNKFYQCPLTRPLVTWLAGRKLNSVLGGSIRFFGIGGAPLPEEVERFLRKARFPYSMGYGLTETAPLVTGTAPFRFPFRSAGAVPRSIELRIAKCGNAAAGVGEIQVRGPNVMMGYYRDEAQTREAFTADGWLRTGDLGSVNGKGKLYVRGRIKALILGPCGENIYPEEIEDLLGTSQIIEEALVYSGEKGELVAMVRLNDAAKAAASAIEHAIEDLRAWANKKLADFSRLSRIEIRQEPFEKTPTMKIKRYLYA